MENLRDFLSVIEEGDKLESSLGDVRKRIPNFNQKLLKFIHLIANESGMSQHKRTYLMKEAETTSDFPFLFGTVLERQLYAKYKAATPDWRNYIKTGTQNDFRPAQILNVFGLQGGLQPVRERGEYKQDAVLTDAKVNISLSKFGREFPLSWETLINDDLGAFSDIMDRLSVAALRTEYRLATGLFTSAAGPNAALYGAPIAHPLVPTQNVTNRFSAGNQLTVTAADGTTTNVTPSFNIDNLSAAASVMRRFIDADGEPVEFDGFELVVPPTLEIRMLQALNPANVVQSGGDSSAGVKGQIRSSSNTAAQLNITGHVNPYLEILDQSANAKKTWYLFAKLSNSGYAARVNFLKGHEAPELCMKAPNKVSASGGMQSPLDGDYESDSVRWRIRHILGGVQTDPLFSAAFVGA